MNDGYYLTYRINELRKISYSYHFGISFCLFLLIAASAKFAFLEWGDYSVDEFEKFYQYKQTNSFNPW